MPNPDSSETAAASQGSALASLKPAHKTSSLQFAAIGLVAVWWPIIEKIVQGLPADWRFAQIATSIIVAINAIARAWTVTTALKVDAAMPTVDDQLSPPVIDLLHAALNATPGSASIAQKVDASTAALLAQHLAENAPAGPTSRLEGGDARG